MNCSSCTAFAFVVAVSFSLVAGPPTEDAESTVEPKAALTRNEAFRKIQSDADARNVLEKAAEDLEAKRYEAALSRIEAVPPEIRDASSALLNARGAALVQLDRIDEASVVFTQALELDPTSFPARFNVGEVLFRQEKYAEAASHFRTIIDDTGPKPLLKFKLYLSLLLAGEESSAGFALRNIRFPLDGPAWYFAQAADQAKLGDADRARDLAAAGRKLHPDDSISYADSLEDAQLLP